MRSLFGEPDKIHDDSQMIYLLRIWPVLRIAFRDAYLKLKIMELLLFLGTFLKAHWTVRSPR